LFRLPVVGEHLISKAERRFPKVFKVIERFIDFSGSKAGTPA